jgi:hypothetical protein
MTELVISGIAVIVAILSATYSYREIQTIQRVSEEERETSIQIARSQLLLQLDERFDKFHHIHVLLRPDGDWAEGRSKPTTVDEWADVEAYMGLFERVYFLLDEGLIKEQIVRDLYRYKISNVVVNATIHQRKLVENAAGWEKFLTLCKRLGISV